MPIKFHDIGGGLMMVEFEYKQDKNRVLKEGPWNFNRCLLLVWEFDSSLQTKNICINEASFWIRVYDLPLMARNEYVGKLIEEALGKMEEINLVYGEFEWGKYMHLKVCVDINKPLLRCKCLNLGLENSIWVRFTYERLLDLCFCFGKLRHGHWECYIQPTTKEECETDGFPYGNWL